MSRTKWSAGAWQWAVAARLVTFLSLGMAGVATHLITFPKYAAELANGGAVQPHCQNLLAESSDHHGTIGPAVLGPL